MIFAGIDIGSITAKAALLKQNSENKSLTLMGTCVIPTGYNPVIAGEKVFSGLLKKTQTSQADVRSIVSTGYGRHSVDFANKAMTEIICHGAGVYFSHPKARGIIDVGGQDSKAIALSTSGQVENFAMNDKCAAGTGRFLEVMANALELKLDELGPLGLTSQTPAKISSICTVFAESEVISMIAAREKRKNIIAGIHDAAAARVAGLANKIKIQAPVIMTGGVAKNIGLVKALENRLGLDIIVAAHAQENGAIGAAVLAAEKNKN
ncbi:MAG: 2-hydroxyglutaryl-CoA dehydratase [Desulfobacter sp.]|nr:2-hydroxyglutaryl-CoA dehydratase [Desulfobacter sp.]WDP86506.1 MAG: 2-hydroxyglutaryl-CoA dehydratase [Desulfobacter sp.]